MKRKKSKKAIPIILIILVLSAMVIGAIVFVFPEQGLLSYDIVWKQNWGHIECVKENVWDTYTKYADDQPIFKCDKYTDECVIDIRNMDTKWTSGNTLNYDICNIDGRNCQNYVINAFQKIGFKSVIINVGQEIVFNGNFWGDDREFFQYTAKWKNFYIKGRENGFIFVQESCVLNDELKEKVLIDGLNELEKSGVNSYQNYMIDFIQTATRTYSYNGRETVCQARQVFRIDSKTFKDGETRKIQGDPIASVECCPQEANCDEDTFTFVKDNIRECTLTSECPNGGNPVADSGTSYVKYECSIEGVCVKSASISAECTNNAICISRYGSRSVCDLSLFNFGNCKKSTDIGGYCGDGVCEGLSGETTMTCPSDCGISDEGFKLSWWIWVLIVVGTIIVIAIIYIAIKFYISVAVLSKSRPESK